MADEPIQINSQMKEQNKTPGIKNIKLKREDCPTEKLLLKVADHVKFSPVNLLRLAVDVGMAEGRFTQKTAQHSEAIMKIVEVIFLVFDTMYQSRTAANISSFHGF